MALRLVGTAAAAVPTIDEAFAAVDAAGLRLVIVGHLQGRVVVVVADEVLFVAAAKVGAWPVAIRRAVDEVLDSRRRGTLRVVD